MHPNGTTTRYTHISEYYVDSGEYEVIRVNFGNPKFVKISFYAGKNIKLDDFVVKHVIGKFKFKFSFNVHGQNSNYHSVNCNKTSPCNIVVRKRT